MNKITILFLLTILSFSLQTYGYEERNLLQIKEKEFPLEANLLKQKQWISLPTYTEREKWNTLFGTEKSISITRGEKYLSYEWKLIKATDFLDFQRTGNRRAMEQPFNENITALSNLFVAELAEGNGRFMDQIINGTIHLCEMTSWVSPAHLSLQKSNKYFPDQNEQVIDLVSGDLGSMLSWVYYFLEKPFDDINPLISKRLYYEIDRRILSPYLETNHLWWMATEPDPAKLFVNNWNPWCNSNVLQCFLLVEKDETKLLQGIRKTIKSVDKFINYNHRDGACEEGPSYWGHASGKMYDYLQLLHDATEGKVSIFEDPIIKNLAEYISRSYVGNDWVVNFADASAKEKLEYNLIYRFGEAVKSNNMMQFASYLKARQSEGIAPQRDLYRYFESLKISDKINKQPALHQTYPYSWYDETEFCYMNQGQFFLACKGGHNGESHNHNDLGTFSLYVDQYPALIDVGVGVYTAKTFSADRYSIWYMQSDFHNLPNINGYAQKDGKTYKAQNTTFDPKRQIFSTDIAKAYPEEAGIEKWVRSYTLGRDNSLKIEDSFAIKKPQTPNRIHFMTWGDVVLKKDGVISIVINGKTLEMTYNSETFDADIQTITIEDARLHKIWNDSIYRISLTAKEKQEKSNYKYTLKLIK